MLAAVHGAARSLALAVVLTACAEPAAGAERCPPAAGAGRHTGEPYQLQLAQYRLADDGQYRIGGARRCARAPAHAAPAGPAPTGIILKPGYRPAARRGAYHGLINAAAKATNIQADLLHAVVAVESAYNPKAVSPKGAQGLMQLMPATAALYTVSNPYDPAQNLRAGARHLRYLLAEFDNDLALALAAYNAGAEAVKRYRNTIPPFRETRDYVRRVIQLYLARLEDLSTTGH